jgi:acetyl-CoA carboxylase biotin carboxyl carrier protein
MARTAGAPRSGASDDERLIDLTRRLAAVITELGLSEVEVESAGLKLRVQRVAGGVPAPVSAPAAMVAGAAAPATAERPVVADAAPLAASITIEAPMVGTFYRASSPTAEPYVREGDVVKEGQILCIIEAMKLMNEIESRAAGRVAKILIENGQPVEYGQALFLLEPQR